MNNANEEGKWWILSGSLESITTALQTVVTMTSSTRNFVSGCFHCGRDAIGCFKRREPPSDGAWFDCEQLHIDHPHCYDNQVILELNNDHTSSTSNQNSNMNHVSRECNGIFATTSPPSPLHLFPSTVVKEEVKNVSLCVTRNYSEEDVSNFEGQTKPKKVLKYKKYKQSLMDSTSFASKLEQDHFGQRNDALRAEGEVLTSKFRRSKSERHYHRPSIRSPVLERGKVFSSSLDFDSQSWEEESLTSLEEERTAVLFGDIWKPHELENAFEVYNSTTFQSFGYIHSVHQKKSSSFKNNSEKFEDVFPSLFNVSDKQRSIEQNNNNNNNNLVKIHSTYDSSQPADTEEENNLVSQLSKTENEKVKENQSHYMLTTEKLKELIKICIFVNSVNELDLNITRFQSKKFNCDKMLMYCEKSFNRKLIFDLVKEAKNEYLMQYSNSLSLSSEYPVSIIENKVISALKFTENCQPYQMAILEDVEKIRQKMLMYSNLSEFTKVPDEILVENVTAEEIKKEGRLWQNVETEEREITIKICDEIFDELLNKDISILDNMLQNKLHNNV